MSAKIGATYPCKQGVREFVINKKEKNNSLIIAQIP